MVGDLGQTVGELTVETGRGVAEDAPGIDGIPRGDVVAGLAAEKPERPFFLKKREIDLHHDVAGTEKKPPPPPPPPTAEPPPEPLLGPRSHHQVVDIGGMEEPVAGGAQEGDTAGRKCPAIRSRWQHR